MYVYVHTFSHRRQSAGICRSHATMVRQFVWPYANYASSGGGEGWEGSRGAVAGWYSKHNIISCFDCVFLLSHRSRVYCPFDCANVFVVCGVARLACDATHKKIEKKYIFWVFSVRRLGWFSVKIGIWRNWSFCVKKTKTIRKLKLVI